MLEDHPRPIGTQNRILRIKLLTRILIGGVVAAACMQAAAAQDVGTVDRAPRWLNDSEICGMYFSADPMTPEQVERFGAFPLIIWGQPATHIRQIRAFHKRGIRALAYVSFYKAPDIRLVEDRRHWQGGSPGVKECKKNPFWRAVNRAGHPEWTLIGEDGSVKRPFDNPKYPPGWDQVCTNVKGYPKAVLTGARRVMDMGFDGLFIDNVHPSECFGPQHGKHRHVRQGLSNPDTYTLLLADVRRLVKRYGDDKVCILNSGEPVKDYAPYGDALMWEHYPRIEPSDDWDGARRGIEDWRAFLNSGKQILGLTHAGFDQPSTTPPGEGSYLSYACAKLSGFLWANDPLRLGPVRIGKPVDEIRAANGVQYRLYERGVVAVNTEDEERVVELPAADAYATLRDLAAGQILQSHDGVLSLRIPGGCGRVYVASPQPAAETAPATSLDVSVHSSP